MPVAKQVMQTFVKSRQGRYFLTKHLALLKRISNTYGYNRAGQFGKQDGTL